MNPIVKVWCQAKKYTRTNCNYTFVGLEKTIVPVLNLVTVELIRKFLEYHRAYREGKQMTVLKRIQK